MPIPQEAIKKGLVNKIWNKINHPGQFFRYGGVRKRQFYHELRRIVSYRTYSRRRNLGNKFVSENEPWLFDDKIGFRIEEPYSLDILHDVVEHAREIVAEASEDELDQVHDAKAALPITKKGETLYLESPFIKLALHPRLVSTATSYLGMLPVLSQVTIWRSPNNAVYSGSSQGFHFDHADVSQMKVFVFIEEVDIDTGPTLVVDSVTSARICKEINYKHSESGKRVDDEIIKKIGGKECINAAVGAPGTMVLCDTNRCLHAGGRKAAKPRTLLVFHYLSPFAFAYPLFGWSKRALPSESSRSPQSFSNLAKRNSSIIDRMILGVE